MINLNHWLFPQNFKEKYVLKFHNVCIYICKQFIHFFKKILTVVFSYVYYTKPHCETKIVLPEEIIYPLLTISIILDEIRVFTLSPPLQIVIGFFRFEF